MKAQTCVSYIGGVSKGLLLICGMIIMPVCDRLYELHLFKSLNLKVYNILFETKYPTLEEYFYVFPLKNNFNKLKAEIKEYEKEQERINSISFKKEDRKNMANQVESSINDIIRIPLSKNLLNNKQEIKEIRKSCFDVNSFKNNASVNSVTPITNLKLEESKNESKIIKKDFEGYFNNVNQKSANVFKNLNNNIKQLFKTENGMIEMSDKEALRFFSNKDNLDKILKSKKILLDEETVNINVVDYFIPLWCICSKIKRDYITNKKKILINAMRADGLITTFLNQKVLLENALDADSQRLFGELISHKLQDNKKANEKLNTFQNLMESVYKL